MTQVLLALWVANRKLYGADELWKVEGGTPGWGGWTMSQLLVLTCPEGGFRVRRGIVSAPWSLPNFEGPEPTRHQRIVMTTVTPNLTAPPSWLWGRMLDLDAHLQMTPDQIRLVMADDPRAEDLATAAVASAQAARVAQGSAPATAPDERTIWEVKGWDALGASDPAGRVRAMDLMGIAQQLVFPQVGLMGRLLWEPTSEARAITSRWNDFVIDWTNATGDRAIATGSLNLTDVDTATAETERAVAAGVGAFTCAHSDQSAGLSPGDSAWDRLWSVLAESGIPLLVHLGGGRSYDDTDEAREAERLSQSASRQRNPYDATRRDAAAKGLAASTRYKAPARWIGRMILDGVLERHPRLRVGIVEYAAHWFAPWAAELDTEAVNDSDVRAKLSLKPSEYLARQVRVTPTFTEPIAELIEANPSLGNCYGFSTDYPHPVGGINPVEAMFATIVRLGDQAVEDYFCRNGLDLIAHVDRGLVPSDAPGKDHPFGRDDGARD